MIHLCLETSGIWALIIGVFGATLTGGTVFGVIDFGVIIHIGNHSIMD
jgi:hypothetical protein